MMKKRKSYRPFSIEKLKQYLDEMNSCFDQPSLTDEVLALRNMASRFMDLSNKCARRADKIEKPFKSFPL
jgi:hypothetical protein